MAGWLDVHAHYVTERYSAACQSAGHGQPDGMPGMPGWSLAAALELMAATGVDAAVLSISSPGVHFGSDSASKDTAARDLAAHVNDAGAQIVAARPAQFGLSAVLPLPDVDGALVEVARAYDELGADAIALKTNYHGRYLSDPEFAPVLAELNARGAVVTLHPTSPSCWEAVALGRPRPMIEFLFDTTRCVVDLGVERHVGQPFGDSLDRPARRGGAADGGSPGGCRRRAHPAAGGSARHARRAVLRPGRGPPSGRG